MSSILISVTVFGLPLVIIWFLYALWFKNKTLVAQKKMEEAEQSGLLEPASLHPIIDPNKCLACGTCVTACPEGKILGLIKRKAVLISPTSCIGHGACREACPTGAITLVFGSEARGVEIPSLDSSFETSVPGIYIAGELGGMGLIKNAIAQGQKAVAAIARKRRNKNEFNYDLVIVGAGPAGLSSCLAAKEKKLKYICLEQDTIGGTVAHYPRGKIVMTQPAVLPLVGKFQFREASKESLVDFWDSVVKDSKLSIKTKQRVEAIEEHNDGFIVKTNSHEFTSKSILLTMGRRGTPRKLGVDGEELPKVVYRLIEPEQYINKHVLVVGGGDSALEAALAIADQPGTEIILSYRSASFSRAKAKNRERVDVAERNGQLKVMMESNVKNITEKSVSIECSDQILEFKNDDIIVCAGGILPTPFLKKIGINVEEKFGTE